MDNNINITTLNHYFSLQKQEYKRLDDKNFTKKII